MTLQEFRNIFEIIQSGKTPVIGYHIHNIVKLLYSQLGTTDTIEMLKRIESSEAPTESDQPFKD